MFSIESKLEIRAKFRESFVNDTILELENDFKRIVFAMYDAEALDNTTSDYALLSKQREALKADIDRAWYDAWHAKHPDLGEDIYNILRASFLLSDEELTHTDKKNGVIL